MPTTATAVMSALAVSLFAAAGESPRPPVAAQRPVTTTLHGDTRVDDYAWLRDKNDPEVITHLEAENAYTRAMMAHTERLQKTLYDEMLGRIKQTDLTVPYRNGPFYYYSRTVKGLDYPIYCRKRGSLEADEQVILERAVAYDARFDTGHVVRLVENVEDKAFGFQLAGVLVDELALVFAMAKWNPRE